MPAAPFAQELPHAARRLQDVVIVGATRERHRARDGEVARQRQAELGGVGFDRDRKARVELDEVEVANRQLRSIERCTAGDARAGTRGEVRTGRHLRHVVRLGARAWIDALVARDAELVGALLRAEQQCARLIDVPGRAMELGVRKRLHRVALGGVADRLGGEPLAVPRRRIVGRDLGETAVHLRETVAVAVDRPPVARAVRAFHDRVQADRHLHPGPQLGRVPKLVLGRQRHVGLVVLLALLGPGAFDARAQDAIARVAADHQRRVGLAFGDGAARVADERLLQHAHRREQRHGTIGADCPRDLAAGILVTPAALGHTDAPDACEQRRRRRQCVGTRVAHGGEHQVERLQCARRIFFALGGDADAYEDGCPRIHASSLRSIRPAARQCRRSSARAGRHRQRPHPPRCRSARAWRCPA